MIYQQCQVPLVVEVSDVDAPESVLDPDPDRSLSSESKFPA